MSKISQEDKNLKNILQGKEVEKKIQVGGYDKEFSEKMKKEKEEERKASESYSNMMASFRMPLFCPKCQSVMTKRLDKKFWNKGYKKCFNCVTDEQHKIRLKGPEAWKEYENKKMKDNAMGWLKDQEQAFNEWKEMALKPRDIVNEDGSLEKWRGDLEGQKKFVKNMEKEFKNMKKDILKRFE